MRLDSAVFELFGNIPSCALHELFFCFAKSPSILLDISLANKQSAVAPGTVLFF